MHVFEAPHLLSKRASAMMAVVTIWPYVTKLRVRHASRTTLRGSLSSRRPTNFVCRR